ncbi:MAG: hypothetical protein WBG71_11380 [Leeuwenhoekiella sp.]
MKKIKPHTDKEDFGLPKDYFAKFGGRLGDEIMLRELMPKKEGFKVPTGYFESNHDRITGSRIKSKVIPMRQKVMATITAVAAVLLIAFLVFRPNKISEPTFESLSYNNLDAYLSQEDVTDYLLEQDDSFLEDTSILETSSLVAEDVFDYLQEFPLNEELIEN